MSGPERSPPTVNSISQAAARPWLLTIARREHARLYERKRLETVDIADPAVLDDPALATGEEPDHSDVRAAILSLEEDYREPLVLQGLMAIRPTRSRRTSASSRVRY